MPLTGAGISNRAAAAILAGTTSAVVISQSGDTATFDLPNLRINGNTTNTAAAAGTGGVALGPLTVASATASVALGSAANATGASSSCLGNAGLASGARSSVVGYSSTASAADSAVVGSQMTNALAASVLLGAGTGNKLLHLAAPVNVNQGGGANTTAVTNSVPVGTVTTAVAVAAYAEFTLTNTYIQATSHLLVYAEGESTKPVSAWVISQTANSCVIAIQNAAAATAAAVKVHFIVLCPQ